MWFRSVYLRSLRDLRAGIFGWGIGMSLTMCVTMASVGDLVRTPQARAQLATIARSFQWNAAAVGVDTVGGYAMFKTGIFIFLVCIWPLLAATRLLRGEEQQGTLDVLLAQPHGRLRVGLEKVAAVASALTAMGLVLGLVLYAGGRAFGGEFGLGDALGYGLDVTLICAVVAGFGLLLSQFTAERGAAAGWTAAFLLVSIAIDMLHRVAPGTLWLSRLSPIYYFNLSKPLVPGHVDLGGYVVQLVLAVLMGTAAIWLFTLRDLGAGLPLGRWLRLPERRRRAAALPVRDWSLGSVYSRGLATLALPTVWWTAGIAGGGVYLIYAIKSVGDQLSALAASTPSLRGYLEAVGGRGLAMNELFLSASFVMLPLLLMAFAVTQVSRWASDEEDGRLELVLATPQRRDAVILGRFAALATATGAVAAITLAATWTAAVATGFALDPGHLAAAVLGMIPLALVTAAIGYLAAGWVRAAVDTGLISFVVGAWFFLNYLGPDLKVPPAALRLSAFYYYGTPLVNGVAWADVLALLIAAGLALAAATWRFTGKDIAT